MDNALVIDSIIALILLAGFAIGWKRGLFKSLMGLMVVALALIGAVMLADMLTEPITDIIAPKVEDAAVSRFSDELDQSAEENGGEAAGRILELLEEYGATDAVMGVLNPLASGAFGAASHVKEAAIDTFRSAVSASIRTVVSSVVHAVLVLVLYAALLLVLKLLTRALDHVFDLPLLSTVNGVGGAAIGLIEAALLVYVVAYIGSHLGVKPIIGHTDDTYLLPIFLNHSPVELISSFTQKG